MNAVSFLTEALQVLAVETAGVVCVAALLFGYVKMMHSH